MYEASDNSIEARVWRLERAVYGQPGAAAKTQRPEDGWGLSYTLERLEQRVQQLAGARLTSPLPPGPSVRETVSPLSGQRIVTRYLMPFTNPKIASVEVDGVRFEPRGQHERELAEKDERIAALRDHAAGLEMHNEGLRTERDGARAELAEAKSRARKWENVAKGDSILLGCVLDERERAERERAERERDEAREQAEGIGRYNQSLLTAIDRAGFSFGYLGDQPILTTKPIRYATTFSASANWIGGGPSIPPPPGPPGPPVPTKKSGNGEP